ncbi:MOSC domain-containing protein [Mesorhizobium sp. BR1-1-16]|uniref:MOSC domain-containing protein n=1 Tax=Mesorhizobium sp. BR1-1-16 TaxID=2876653 RepID=UPI001CCB362E|nr:MOSC domain-containing protein [Mesorhizobium sp. BR1-1-16]MBZ9935480.1 MOSC domain-containing protein [Mesorhizobium sp. BR1-1-16]
MTPTVETLYRYPVKGFSPEALGEVVLEPGRPIRGDRIYAIENGPSGFDPAAPAFQPKIKFLCLMKNARLAKLRTVLEPGTHAWHVEGADGSLTAELAQPEGRAAAEAWLAAFMGEELRGPLRVLSAPGHSFSDVGKPFVSLINLASVAALSVIIGRTVDPLRFRANINLTGWPPFAELDLVGREARLGEARVTITKRTRRCVATNVDPATAERDMAIPATLQQHFDHMDCGVYAEVIEGGRVAPGDRLTLV